MGFQLPASSYQLKGKASWKLLRMNRGPMRCVCGLSYSLRHRRMRVNRAQELFDRAFETQRQRGLGNELGRAPTDHVDAEDFVVLLVEHDLDEPLRVARDARPGKDAELERAGFHVVAPLLRFPLGETYAPDLRIAVGAGRDLIVVDSTVRFAGDALRDRDTFGRRQMRQLRMARCVERDHIADGRNPRHVRAKFLIDVDVAALQPQTRVLGAEPGGDGAPAGRDEQIVHPDPGGPAVGRQRLDVDAVRAGLRARDPCAGQDLDALLPERTFELGGDRLVLDRYDSREQFDESDVAAKAAEDRGELDPDRTASHDGER